MPDLIYCCGGSPSDGKISEPCCKYWEDINVLTQNTTIANSCCNDYSGFRSYNGDLLYCKKIVESNISHRITNFKFELTEKYAYAPKYKLTINSECEKVYNISCYVHPNPGTYVKCFEGKQFSNPKNIEITGDCYLGTSYVYKSKHNYTEYFCNYVVEADNCYTTCQQSGNEQHTCSLPIEGPDEVYYVHK